MRKILNSTFSILHSLKERVRVGFEYGKRKLKIFKITIKF